MVVGDKLTNQFCLVRWMSINDQKDLALHSSDQALEELAEHRGGDRTLHRHEAKVPQGIDRREHVEAKACSGGLDHRRLSYGCPGGASMVVRSDAGFVGKEDQRAFLLRTFGDPGILGVLPALHAFRVLLPGPVQWSLRGEAEPLHQSTYRHLRQLHAELPNDQLPDDPQGPERVLKLELKRRLVADHSRQPRHLPGVELGRRTRYRLGCQRLLSAVVVRRQPSVDGSPIDPQSGRHRFRALARLHSFNPSGYTEVRLAKRDGAKQKLMGLG